MVKVQNIDCSIADRASKQCLGEYGVSSNDRSTQAYIAMPASKTGLTVHVRSEEFKAWGLAVFVFIDGRYQTNHTSWAESNYHRKGGDNSQNSLVRRGLRSLCLNISNEIVPVTRPRVHISKKIEGVLDEKHPFGDGDPQTLVVQASTKYSKLPCTARKWKFDIIDTTDHSYLNDVNGQVSESAFSSLGTIKVAVLRCVPNQFPNQGDGPEFDNSGPNTFIPGETTPEASPFSIHNAGKQSNERLFDACLFKTVTEAKVKGPRSSPFITGILGHVRTPQNSQSGLPGMLDGAGDKWEDRSGRGPKGAQWQYDIDTGRYKQARGHRASHSDSSTQSGVDGRRNGRSSSLSLDTFGEGAPIRGGQDDSSSPTAQPTIVINVNATAPQNRPAHTEALGNGSKGQQYSSLRSNRSEHAELFDTKRPEPNTDKLPSKERDHSNISQDAKVKNPRDTEYDVPWISKKAARRAQAAEKKAEQVHSSGQANDKGDNNGSNNESSWKQASGKQGGTKKGKKNGKGEQSRCGSTSHHVVYNFKAEVTKPDNPGKKTEDQPSDWADALPFGLQVTDPTSNVDEENVAEWTEENNGKESKEHAAKQTDGPPGDKLDSGDGWAKEGTPGSWGAAEEATTSGWDSGNNENWNNDANDTSTATWGQTGENSARTNPGVTGSKESPTDLWNQVSSDTNQQNSWDNTAPNGLEWGTNENNTGFETQATETNRSNTWGTENRGNGFAPGASGPDGKPVLIRRLKAMEIEPLSGREDRTNSIGQIIGLKRRWPRHRSSRRCRVPAMIAQNLSISHGMRQSKGTVQRRAAYVPQYYDTLKKPYATFVFKLRSKEIVDELFEVDIGNDSQDATRADSKGTGANAALGREANSTYDEMTNEQLVAEIIRRRGTGLGNS
ncbi:MAG: hypothetical protein M1814_000801 [Vezdaea aestivalis]|nr:MAG: hypothetical protein M1814_000801 [Vezdaea aestivalis]